MAVNMNMMEEFNPSFPILYHCFHCGNDLSLHEHIISTNYKCDKGRAFYFYQVKNVVEGENIEVDLISGRYIISYIYCKGCSTKLGWKYHKAFIARRKDKEGKFVLKRSKISKICS